MSEQSLRHPSPDALDPITARELLERLHWAHRTTYHEDIDGIFREVLTAPCPTTELRRLTAASGVATTREPALDLHTLEEAERAIEQSAIRLYGTTTEQHRAESKAYYQGRRDAIDTVRALKGGA